jgi:hypothetical protein
MPEEHVTAYACGADTIEASLRCFINGVNQLKNRQSASAVQAKENE